MSKKAKKQDKVLRAIMPAILKTKPAFRERNMMTDAVAEGCHGAAMYDHTKPQGGPVGEQR